MESRSASSTGSAQPGENYIMECAHKHSFTGVKKLYNIANLQYEKLLKGSSNEQYLSFKHCTERDFDVIDGERDINKILRKTHYKRANLLIVKLNSPREHNQAHLQLSTEVWYKFCEMGVHREALAVGKATFTSLDGSMSKEGDQSFRPTPARLGASAWPTIVFEAGLSHSLANLRVSAQEWLANSGGDVKIVIIISVTLPNLRLYIENWGYSPVVEGPNTRARHRQRQPKCLHEITVDLLGVTGGPLILEFEKIFLRQALPPREKDIELSDQDLLRWADIVFNT